MAPSSSVRPAPAPRAPSPRETAWLEAFEEHLRHERNRSPQTVRAYLADLRALIDHVAGQLSWHKRPREVVFLDALPRNPMGKVQKKLLGT